VIVRRSAGVLLYRLSVDDDVQLLLGHMGGPFWARRDAGAWSIPKGEYAEGEDPLEAARREFAEETGHVVPAGTFLDLGEVRQSGGKRVGVWAARGDLDPATAVSNTFELEWPPRSGVVRTFPEVDRVAWVSLDEARNLLVKGQVPFVDRLIEALTRS
jgi:predicted NUDIX family NTP pyrophosphohydrolase